MSNVFEKLEDTLREAMREMKSVQLTRDNLTNDIAALESAKSKLSVEVNGLDEQVIIVRNTVKEERTRQINETEDNLKKSSELKAHLDAERSRISQLQAENEKQAQRLQNMIDENQRRSEELTQKHMIVDEKLKEIEAFKSKLMN